MPKNTTIRGLGKQLAKATEATRLKAAEATRTTREKAAVAGEATRVKATEAGQATVTRARDLSRVQQAALTGVATLGAAALTVGLATAGGGDSSTTAEPAAATGQVKEMKGELTDRGAGDELKRDSIKEKLGADSGDSADTPGTPDTTDGDTASTEAGKKADADAKADRSGDTKANRSTERAVTYPDNLDGWIRESLAIMEKNDIPGSYEGIHRNIIRESSGNPQAINNWDINAINGIPSKGLLQVIPPTFDAYHVEGTPYDIWNPVSNIVAACNYAADRYGTMDNVDSAY